MTPGDGPKPSARTAPSRIGPGPRTVLSFTREARLTSRQQFTRVFQKPLASRDGFFRVLYRSNGGPRSRLGLAVSKKACSTAVGRHRLKRIVRESFRHRQAELVGPGAVDIVVLPSPAAAGQSSDRLRSSLERHWTRIRALTRQNVAAAPENDPGGRHQPAPTGSAS